MKIYFSLNHLPELKGLTNKQRRDIYGKYTSKWKRHWQGWAYFILAVLVLILGAYWSDVLLRERVRLLIRISVLICSYVVGFSVLEICRLNLARPYLKHEVEFWKRKGFL